MCFFIGIACQEALASELVDLLAYQALFVEAVAYAFGLRGGVVVELGEHVVAAEPVAVVGKAWVGFYQVACCWVRG